MRTILCWLLLFLAAGQAAGPLTCVVPKREIALRKGGTVLLDAELTNHTRGLLEGRLEATVLRGGRRSSTHVSTELIIPPGPLKTQLLLPPPLDSAYGEGFAVQLAFVGKDSAIPLGDHPVGQFPQGGEEFILAIARTSRRISDLDRVRERSARLEKLRPALETSAWFLTASLSVPVENLPTHPAGWCAYDVVLLDAPAFAELTARQLDALARWIEAGGSAVVIAEGAIRERQLVFLQRMAGPEQTIHVDAQGRLERRENARFTAGLGRLLMAAAPPGTPAEADANDWRVAVAWLWKVQPHLLRDIRENGVWPARRAGSQGQWTNLPPQSLERWARGFAMGADRQAVERPRPLPIGWVALLLASLLILAGPADWFLLGSLRRRRWTWVVFPAVCLAFAWVASRMATQYLGPKTRHTAVRVTDLGEGGRVLREVVFNLRVPSSDEEWATETIDGLSSAIPPMGQEESFGNFEPVHELPETRAEWLSHSRVLLRQNLRQWTPNWQQTVSFARSAVPAGPDWQSLIAEWKRKASGSEEPLTSWQYGYSIYFLPGRGEFQSSGQVVAADSPIPAEIALLLGKDESPMDDVLQAASPVMTAREMLGASPRDRLAILAWRRSDEGLEVLRRHVSTRELDAAP